MDNRIIRDIRYFELKPDNYVGNFDGILGNIFKSSFEIKCIGQRIARKLNELKFNTGDFDHIYINLTTKLENGEIIDYDFEYDKQIRCFDFGQNQDEFNSLPDNERERTINAITFKVLKWKFRQDENNSTLIDIVETLIEKEGRKIVINYKNKETNSYKINIGFQISPTDNTSKIVIDHSSKKDNTKFRATIDLHHYEDIYYLVDKISIEGHKITLHPKKSSRAEFATKQYLTPLTIDINKLEPAD